MIDHCRNGMTTATPRIGIADALLTIGLLDSGDNQFEVGVIAMHGIGQNFGQRHSKETRGDRPNDCWIHDGLPRQYATRQG